MSLDSGSELFELPDGGFPYQRVQVSRQPLNQGTGDARIAQGNGPDIPAGVIGQSVEAAFSRRGEGGGEGPVIGIR